MDPQKPKNSLVNRIVSGIKDKTVKLAESKLQASFTEEVPEEAILGIVASAVRLGARKLIIRVQANDLVLTHNGRKLTEVEVGQLNRGTQSLPELSRGFKIHLGKDDGKLDMQFITETGMKLAKFNGFATPVISEADLNDMALANMTTRVLLKGTGNYRRVNQAMGNELPEVALIRKRCFLAPIDIIVSGKSIDRYQRIPDSLISSNNFDRESHASLSNVASTPSQGVQADLSHLKEHLSNIGAGICGICRSSSDAGWFYLQDGIARPLNQVSWPSQTWGFLSVSNPSDATLLQTEIKGLVAHLTARLFVHVKDNNASHAQESLTYLEQNRETLSAAGVPTVDQDRAFLQLRELISPSSDPRVLNNRLELASSLEASGETAESEKLYAEVLPVWESEALNHFDKYRFEEGAALWQRALSLREKLGHDQNDLADKYLRLAEIGREQRLGFAEQAYRRTLQLVRSCQVDNKEREYQVLIGLAQVLKKNRVLTESLRLAEEAQATLLALNDGKETKALVPVLKLQAEIYDLNNDYARSTDFEQKAMLLRFKK